MNNHHSAAAIPSLTTTSTPSFDNLLLHSLMSRLHLPNPSPPPPKTLEDLLFSDLLLNLSSDTEDSDNDTENPSSSKSLLLKEESRLEKEIVRTILSGDIEKLKANTGQAVAIGEHHICIGYQEEAGSEYRVWEWHGHVMLFDEENGYTPEYIYGNYFERVGVVGKRKAKMEIKEEEKKVNAGGLKELIEAGETGGGRILHRNLNANSSSSSQPRFILK